MKKAKSLNIKGKLVTLDEPWVMGILNVTPDSFYAASRVEEESEIYKRIETILLEGGRIVDIGGCSTRPGAYIPTEEEERERLEGVLSILMHHYPGVIVSVDTFRSEVARRAAESFGDIIINDISAGEDDPEMLPAVAGLGLEYVAMHKRGNPRTMDSMCAYPRGVVAELTGYFRNFADRAEAMGIRNWVLDPGFGFAKTEEQNLELLERLGEFKALGRPILVGIADKRFTHGDTEKYHRIALRNGADILRVHDVAAAKKLVVMG